MGIEQGVLLGQQPLQLPTVGVNGQQVDALTGIFIVLASIEKQMTLLLEVLGSGATQVPPVPDTSS